MRNRPCRARASGATHSSRILMLALLACAASSAARAQEQAAAPTSAAPRSPAASREVRLTLTITNERGDYIAGVGREHVEVFEGETPREIKSFGTAEAHASVGVLFDISRSMREGQGNRIEAARLAFARFARRASPLNEYFLWAFNKNVKELTGWARGLDALDAGLNKIAPETTPKDGDGGTALYDACAAALDKLSGGPLPRRVLLIFTDGGQDNYSRRVRLKELKRLVRDSEALVYAVIIVDSNNAGTLDAEGQAQLGELAAGSGGRAYVVEGVRELEAVVERVASDLSHQYAVGFVPADGAKKGELNRVKVRIKPPPGYKKGLRVRSREGYLTPE